MSLDQVDMLARIGLTLVIVGPLVSIFGVWSAIKRKRIGILLAGFFTLGVGIVCLVIAAQAWAAV